MKKIILLAIILGFAKLSIAQGIISFSGIVPTSGGIGLDMGYHKINSNPSFGFISFYGGTGKNEIKTKGEFYSNIGQREFSEDINEQGINLNWFGFSCGLSLAKFISAGVVLGTFTEKLTQQRFDRLTILGNNGTYYTAYEIETRIDLGLTINTYFEVGNNLYVLPSTTYTNERGLIINLGIAFGLH
jgi:hypothetical protein